MVKKRKKIPRDVQDEILFSNDRTCCICNDKNKGVHIHHINEDPSNNSLENLAVVCAEHHDEIHSKGGLSKGISESLLKKYKQSWELAVREKRIGHHAPLASESKIEEKLFLFEIRKSVYRLHAISDSNVKAIEEELEFLYGIQLLEGYRKEILEDLNHVVISLALDSKNKSSMIADKIFPFFYHLPGPDEIAITNDDKRELFEAIEILETIGHFSGEFNKSLKVIKSASSSLGNIWNIIIWYDLKKHAEQMIVAIDKITKACNETYNGEKPLNTGVAEMKALKKKLLKVTLKERPQWKKIIQKLV